MFEEENGYELVHKMTESSEDLTSLPNASGDTNQEDHDSSKPVQASLFGESEDILNRDPSRKGPRDWFNGCNPEFVHLIFWQCPKRSGLAFSSVLCLLLCFASFSLISIVAYCTLLLLAFSTAFTVYRRIHGSISRNTPNATATSNPHESHPLRALLELDLTLKPARLANVVEPFCDPFNRFVIKARAVILIENVLDSAKFAAMMWLLTYIGACFNALSLLVLAWVGFFSVPVLYEKNQSFVDAMVGELIKRFRAITNDVYASVEPKLQVMLDKMPPTVRNAFQQILGGSSKTPEKIQ